MQYELIIYNGERKKRLSLPFKPADGDRLEFMIDVVEVGKPTTQRKVSAKLRDVTYDCEITLFTAYTTVWTYIDGE